LAAILSSPPDQDIKIELDNQAVVIQFNQLVVKRECVLPRQRFRANFAALWAVIHQEVSNRTGKVKVVWVRGHSDNLGNNMAYKIATTAVRRTTTPWIVDLAMQSDIKHHGFFCGHSVEIDTRQLLKKQTTVRRHQAWIAQKSTKRAIKDIDGVEWRSTLSHLHDKRAVHTFYSNSKDTYSRSHHIKKLLGMLPTLNVMHARNPGLYPDRVCRVCEIQDEDNYHLWTCSKLQETHVDIWEKALELIDDWGEKAVKKYNKKTITAYNKAIEAGKQVVLSAPVLWKSLTRSMHVKGLACIGGTQSLLEGEDKHDRSPDLAWCISDLYRGITPKILIDKWGSQLGTLKSIARTVIHKFVGYLESEATERIWKPRCKITVEYEKSIGITAREKKSKYKGPRGPWHNGNGYITQEGYCTCGQLLDVHEEGRCPGEKLDPFKADSNLLQSLLRRRRLELMEGMGRIPFL
jgi:hypothetical protein